MLTRIVALSAVVASTWATQCPVLTQPRLCGSESVSLSLTECNSTNINFPNFEPCCRLQTEQMQKCDDPDAAQACRSVEVSTGLCPSSLDQSCCFRKDMSMRLNLEFQVSNKTCCSKCRCYGDPHCESFDGTPDTWVICDARKPNPGNPDRCPMNQALCVSQLDHLGKPCAWIQTGNTWDIGMQGSPCVFNPSTTPPFMVLYQADNFKLTLNMGERSVIKHLIIEDAGNTYVLGAEDCFSAAYATVETNPWRLTASEGQVPPTMPDDWLPYKWGWGPLDGDDVMWNVDNLKSLIDISVRCTRTVKVVSGRRRYGPPRLNVDIVEPLNWKDIDQRPNSSGFCVKGSIVKQGDHAQTDMIDRNQWCANSVDLLDVAKLLCGKGTTSAGVEGCKIRWCTNPSPFLATRSSTGIQQCLSDINLLGWETAYCSTMLLAEPVLGSNCNGNAACRTCLNDIRDFGWDAAIAKYGDVPSSAGDCVTRAELPPDLVGCQKGVRVQYFLATLNTWVTSFAVPVDTCLQNGYVTITQQTDPDLFIYPMRIIQCSEPKGTCLTNKCATEAGFTASIELDVQTSEIETVYNLYEAGLLVCNPALFPNPDDCLGFTPEAMCPCSRRLKESDRRELKYVPNN